MTVAGTSAQPAEVQPVTPRHLDAEQEKTGHAQGRDAEHHSEDQQRAVIDILAGRTDGPAGRGEAAERVGLTIRHYEEAGLIVPSARSDGGFRLYTVTSTGSPWSNA